MANLMTVGDEAVGRKRLLDRERGRRYRERHRERFLEMSRVKSAEWRAANPELAAEVSRRSSAKVRARISANLLPELRARADKFWSQVDRRSRSECWLWMGKTTEYGYGRFNIAGGKWITASRAAYMLRHGDLEKRTSVLHKCDTPLCCNPFHLYAGTQKQNVQDIYDRGRNTPRSGHKITEEVAMKIFSAEGTQNEIARRFGVSRSFVSLVKSGKRWPRIHS